MPKENDIEVILLAAGLSTRMGTQKLLLPFGEKTVLQTVIDNLRAAGFAKINAVLSKDTYDSIAESEYLKKDINEAPERGQSSSLLIGLEMLPPNSDFCIMLGDLPLVRAESIKSLREKFYSLSQQKSLLAPFGHGHFGHPMFYRSLWKERFIGATGDKGGKNIIKKHQDEIETVSVPDFHFKDMDTKEEYKACLSEAKKRCLMRF